MGSNACNGLCQKNSSAIEPFDDQFLPTQTLIPCQICSVQLDEIKFKEHIDHHHFCCIVEDKQGFVNAKCLLCEHLSNNLEEQANHIKAKHSYAIEVKADPKSTIATSVESGSKDCIGMELYRSKKGRISKLESQKQFQILKGGELGQIEASIKGERFKGILIVKEYRGADFDELLAEGELIWFKIFRSEEHYQFYYLDVEPKERSIVCKAYLFVSP